jgi:hypothetical protein
MATTGTAVIVDVVRTTAGSEASVRWHPADLATETLKALVGATTSTRPRSTT